jgi:hypothetical protein
MREGVHIKEEEEIITKGAIPKNGASSLTMATGRIAPKH